jgi:hypothetical protein
MVDSIHFYGPTTDMLKKLNTLALTMNPKSDKMDWSRVRITMMSKDQVVDVRNYFKIVV